MGQITRALSLGLLALAVGGCSGGITVPRVDLGNLNPVGWFSSDDETPDAEAPAREIEPPDRRPKLTEVSRARISPTPHGLIVQAEGMMPTKGHHSPDLRPLDFGRPNEDGEIWLDMVATGPRQNRLFGEEGRGISIDEIVFTGLARRPRDPEEEDEPEVAEDPTRPVIAAAYLPNATIAGATSINIAGEDNTVTIPLR